MSKFPKKPRKPDNDGDDDDDESGSDVAPRYRGKPIIVEPRCKVCQSAYRKDIDKYLVQGMSPAEIARYFEALGEQFTRKSIWTHRSKHLELQSSALRQIIEDKARAAMLDVEETKTFLLTKESVLQTLLQQGYEALTSGKTMVEPRELLAVIEKLEKMQAEQERVAVDEMMREFQAFASAVKRFVPESTWSEIVRQFELNLSQTGGSRPLEQLVGPPEPVDVEIIREETDDDVD